MKRRGCLFEQELISENRGPICKKKIIANLVIKEGFKIYIRVYYHIIDNRTVFKYLTKTNASLPQWQQSYSKEFIVQVMFVIHNYMKSFYSSINQIKFLCYVQKCGCVYVTPIY